MDKRVLFVCLGNICRSPAAEGIFETLAVKEGLSVIVDSAGTYGGHSGERADKRMRIAAFNRGYDLKSLSRKVTSNDFDNFDMIIAMDDYNYEELSRLAPAVDSLNKLYRMRDFSVNSSVQYVPDPYYEGVEGFEVVLDILEDCCEGLIKSIKNQ